MDDKRDLTPSPLITKTITELLESGSVAVVITVVVGDQVGAKLIVEEKGTTSGGLGDAALDAAVVGYASSFLASRLETRMMSVNECAPEYVAAGETFLLFERIQPAPRLVICGAGHVGAALAKLASFVGYHTTLIDDRAEFLERERFPDRQIHLVVATDWSRSVRDVVGDGRGVAVAVVTRGHNEDEICMREVVRANPDYVGLIGSKRRTSIVIERLREGGATGEQLKKIRAPIGLDIGAVSPEEVALAIISEIVAERHGGKGGSLSAWRRMSDML
jgi:xanthine dehydrogenase accessory factor